MRTGCQAKPLHLGSDAPCVGRFMPATGGLRGSTSKMSPERYGVLDIMSSL